MRRRTGVGALVAASLAAGVLLFPTTSTAAGRPGAVPTINYGWSPSMSWGFGVRPISRNNANRCHSGTKVWIQEHGKSGVTQLKAKFELRAPYDTGFYGTSYQTQGWYYSLAFADDTSSNYAYFVGQFWYPVGGQYKIRGVLVGIRPGFWRIDRQAGVTLGPVGCEISADDGSGGGPVVSAPQS